MLANEEGNRAGAVGIVKCVKLPSLGAGDSCRPSCFFLFSCSVKLTHDILQIMKSTSSSGTLPNPPSPSWPHASPPCVFSSAKKPLPGPRPHVARASRSSRSPSSQSIAIGACSTLRILKWSERQIFPRKRCSKDQGLVEMEGVQVGVQAGVKGWWWRATPWGRRVERIGYPRDRWKNSV